MLKKQQVTKHDQLQQFSMNNSFIYQPIETVDGRLHLKKYHKLQKIGSGSYSKCYLVRNIESESTYAVKIIPKNKLQILMREKLFYEIKIHQSLAHPNIVYFDHWFEDQDYQYIFMEYCANRNLETRLKNSGGVMGEKQIKMYAWQITSAIQYIHQQKIMHRDLKLCNFYLDAQDHIKLGDYGFACQLANQNDRKRESCGTPNYIAPETISGYGYSISSDVWSIGVILYRLKFGFCPFQGVSVRSTLEKVKTCNYKFPKNIKISPQLKDLIQKILNINYDDRLTTYEILEHKFFDNLDTTDIYPKIKNKKKHSQNRSNSLFSKIFSVKKDKKSQVKTSTNQKQDQLKKQSKNSEIKQSSQTQSFQSSNFQKQSQKQTLIKKSNSCDTFKQIKQIFKSKSKNKTINQHHFTQLDSLQTIPTLNTAVGAYTSSRYTEQTQNRDNCSLWMQFGDNHGQGSLMVSSRSRSNIVNQGLKKQQSASRLSRINQFVKQKAEHIAYQKIPVSNSNSALQIMYNNGGKDNREKNIKESISSYKSKMLMNQITGNYYLPLSIQFQKDVIVINYEDNIKQIIYQAETHTVNTNNSQANIPQKWNKFIAKQKDCYQKNNQLDAKQLKQISKTTMDVSSTLVASYAQQPKNNTKKQSKYYFSYVLFQDGHQIKIYMSDSQEQTTISELPKIVRYVIENKIQWLNNKDIVIHKQSYHQQEQDIFMQQKFSKKKTTKSATDRVRIMLAKVAKQWTATKDGIILKYVIQQQSTNVHQSQLCKQLIVGKISSQHCFYVTATIAATTNNNSEPTIPKQIKKHIPQIVKPQQNDKTSIFMYTYDPSKTENYNLVEQVGITRMYAGWLKLMLKK